MSGRRLPCFRPGTVALGGETSPPNDPLTFLYLRYFIIRFKDTSIILYQTQKSFNFNGMEGMVLCYELFRGKLYSWHLKASLEWQGGIERDKGGYLLDNSFDIFPSWSMILVLRTQERDSPRGAFVDTVFMLIVPLFPYQIDFCFWFFWKNHDGKYCL